MSHRLWLPAVAIHRLGVVEIAPSPHHCFCTAHPCAQSEQSQFSPDPAGKDSATSSPILTEAGTSVRLSFQSRSLLLLADESSGVTVRMKLFRDFNLLAVGCRASDFPFQKKQFSVSKKVKFRFNSVSLLVTLNSMKSQYIERKCGERNVKMAQLVR